VGGVQLLAGHFRQPDMPDLALLDQLGECANGVRERHLGVDEVEVVQVDVIGAEAQQGGVDGGLDVIGV
jgi:hypothetical protein